MGSADSIVAMDLVVNGASKHARPHVIADHPQ